MRRFRKINTLGSSCEPAEPAVSVRGEFFSERDLKLKSSRIDADLIVLSAMKSLLFNINQLDA